jgi:peptide-methionine (S)-S-oxide reductase
MTTLLDHLQKIPLGYSKASYLGKTYGVSRTDFNQGKSIKVYAEELGGKDFISFNFYQTQQELLKPCEMPLEKVLDFLQHADFSANSR